MYSVSVIPISRGIATEKLTYFSKENLMLGSVVAIPLRKKTAYGIVIKSKLVSETKVEIKNADFKMRKVGGNGRKIISPSFISAAEESAEYHVSMLGSALYELIPKAILSHLDTINEYKGVEEDHNNIRQAFVLQENDDDRFAHYKGIIREKFARKKSVFLIMPSAEDVKKAREYFEKGIREYTYVFHTDIKQTEIVRLWNKALEDNHPILVIATGIFLSIPRHDIGAIIIERENSRGYKNIGRPFIDMRHVAERLAEHLWADIIFGDSCLRVETLERHNNGELVEYAPLSFRSLTTAEDRIIDMRLYRSGEKGFQVFSLELTELIKQNKTNNESMFIFAARKGVAPSTVCADCEHVLSCGQCSAPLVLYGKVESESRFYLCNRCGTKYGSDTKCRRCSGWRLRPLGIGTELIEDEIRLALPDVKVFRLDKTTATTHRKALSLTEKWLSSPGSVLVGTEMALTYIDRKIDNTAIASLDSYFSIPDFRVSEKIFLTILKIRSLTQKKFLIQTRHPANPVITSAAKGNTADFFREELATRKMLGFPPFSVLVKISCHGTREKVLEQIKLLKTVTKGYEIDIFPAFVSLPRNQVMMHGLIRIPRNNWPDRKLIDVLSVLPPSFTVNIDPESLL